VRRHLPDQISNGTDRCGQKNQISPGNSVSQIMGESINNAKLNGPLQIGQATTHANDLANLTPLAQNPRQ
jgi:hypothetical protein